MSTDDMIFNKKDGKVTAVGWNINSELLQNDFPLSSVIFHENHNFFCFATYLYLAKMKIFFLKRI